ncbi:hypothetical protein PSN45_002963 [Yamadazyma tenuis]|uniref:uncharacterized protein n=1 Tax=Candida tenuis TaxID=2315449 RepID=UPI0027A9D252|nr:hypothetical protein PSN45_002963 [Yamadazyma tenuis]
MSSDTRERNSLKTPSLHETISEVAPNSDSIWSKKKIYRSWLLLCYATGPVASMSRTYVPAAIQSIATLVGRTSQGGVCARRGNDCYVKFGTSWVHSTSYVLYLKAISTAVEGVIAILFMGIADYSNYRKILLCGSILFYGLIALPFAGLTDKTYATMTGLSVLYALLNVTDCVYQITEGSYIPLFMRASSPKGETSEEVRRNIILKRGSTVSVMGIVLGNCGGLTALLIGIIISYGRGGPIANGYHNFLLAITIAGCLTVVFSIISAYFIPSVQAKPKPKGEFLLFLSIKRCISLLKNITKYPQAFIYCISWVIWNVSYSNFLSVFVLLFRSTLGIGSSDAEYTVYTFISYIVASLGSLGNFWGTLGINSKVKIGFKHRWEFWVFEVLFNASGSSLRSMNRAVYSTLLPEGDEAQYFGLEIMLGIATGWIGSLVNATIQDRTNNDRFPFLPNMFLALIALGLYSICDTEKGMRDVEKLVDGDSGSGYDSIESSK